IREQKVRLVACLCLQTQARQEQVQTPARLGRRFAISREEQHIVGIAEVVQPRHLELSVELGQIDVGKQAGDGRSEGNADLRGAKASPLLVGKGDPLVQQTIEIVCRIDQRLELRQQQFVVDAPEIVGDVPFHDKYRA